MLRRETRQCSEVPSKNVQSKNKLQHRFVPLRAGTDEDIESNYIEILYIYLDNCWSVKILWFVIYFLGWSDSQKSVYINKKSKCFAEIAQNWQTNYKYILTFILPNIYYSASSYYKYLVISDKLLERTLHDTINTRLNNGPGRTETSSFLTFLMIGLVIIFSARLLCLAWGLYPSPTKQGINSYSRGSQGGFLRFSCYSRWSIPNT